MIYSIILNLNFSFIFSSPEPKALGELIGWDSSRRPRVGWSVHTFRHEYLLDQLADHFHLKHHWVGGLAALSFGQDQIRTLVSMATDSSHRLIMGKTL